MKTALFATLVAGILTGALATGLFLSGTDPAPTDPQAGADPAVLHHGPAGDVDHDSDGHADTGMHRPAFAAARGSVPDEAKARQLEEVHHLVIRSDEDFDPANGVRNGSGTLDDPYVISGYYVTGDLYIADTDACVIVRENYVGGQLTLNWNGQCVHVHHNFVRDLRVNENVKRSGYATGGLLEANKIAYVGQLRHYDGEFRNNIVGPFEANDIFDAVLETVDLPWTREVRVANVDGFNQGLIHHNTFYGSVDLDLHGHHHGTGFFAHHSHYHGIDEERDMDHDHTDRWTSVAFTDNRIIDPEGYGLRYDDIAHAGDDRTARSETEEELDLEHRHHTWVTIARNTVEGGGIWIDVFNADDMLHVARNPGWLEVLGNTVTVHERDDDTLLGLIRFGYDPRAGIHLDVAKEVEAIVEGNTVTWVPMDDADRDPVERTLGDLWAYEEPAAGIRLYHLQDANLTVTKNTVDGFPYGVYAQHLDEDVSWTVQQNTFKDVAHEVWWDDSVANEPRT